MTTKNKASGLGQRDAIDRILDNQIHQQELEKQIDKRLKDKSTKDLIDSRLAEKLPDIVQKEVKKAEVEVKASINSETKKIADESFEGLREKLEKDRLNVIQATTITTVFIGFLVIQFNILQGNKPTNEVAGLSLLLLASIIIFTLLLDMVIKLDLPFKKYETKEGAISGLNKVLGSLFTTRNEEVALGFQPKTWGDGLKIRAVALAVSLLIGILGVLLIAA